MKTAGHPGGVESAPSITVITVGVEFGPAAHLVGHTKNDAQIFGQAARDVHDAIGIVKGLAPRGQVIIVFDRAGQFVVRHILFPQQTAIDEKLFEPMANESLNAKPGVAHLIQAAVAVGLIEGQESFFPKPIAGQGQGGLPLAETACDAFPPGMADLQQAAMIHDAGKRFFAAVMPGGRGNKN
ncbi:MAG: hypothetical protein HY360_23325 [Verrucomicrobia bacterium]|nr:hypothetical protein [Verrucomicrobiota bacterium]